MYRPGNDTAMHRRLRPACNLTRLEQSSQPSQPSAQAGLWEPDIHPRLQVRCPQGSQGQHAPGLTPHTSPLHCTLIPKTSAFISPFSSIVAFLPTQLKASHRPSARLPGAPSGHPELQGSIQTSVPSAVSTMDIQNRCYKNLVMLAPSIHKPQPFRILCTRLGNKLPMPNRPGQLTTCASISYPPLASSRLSERIPLHR